MIVKVKEPQEAEWKMLREDQIIFTYLHLAADPKQAKGLIDAKCHAIAYETITDSRGALPLLAPMSEIAGRLAVFEGAYHLKKTCGGPGGTRSCKKKQSFWYAAIFASAALGQPMKGSRTPGIGFTPPQ